MTPTWNPEEPSLLQALVCYADILGFRAMTQRALESGEEMEYLRRIKRSLAVAYEKVREAQSPYGEVPDIFDMKVFTDNIVVAYPLLAPSRDLGEPELGHLLMLFAEVQASLAADGFLLRGAIAFGNHYQDDDIAYGGALLEAVDLDKSGGPPKLVIGPSVNPLIAEHVSWYGGGWSPQQEQLLEDPCDGRLFVNYLWVAFEHFPDGPIDYQLLAAHKELVLRGLREYESNSYVREKYEWMATYHNYVCRTFADGFLVQSSEGTEPERMSISDEAQRALEHLVPFEDLPSVYPPRPLDAQRLRPRFEAS